MTLNENDHLLILLCKFKTKDEIDALNVYLRQHLTDHFLPNLIVPFDMQSPIDDQWQNRSRTITFSLSQHARNDLHGEFIDDLAGNLLVAMPFANVA